MVAASRIMDPKQREGQQLFGEREQSARGPFGITGARSAPLLCRRTGGPTATQHTPSKHLILLRHSSGTALADYAPALEALTSTTSSSSALLGHPAPAGECRGLAAPLPPPHSSGTALADYAPALKLPSSASDSAAAAPGHCPRVTDLSAAARRGPKLPASAAWVVTLPHPRLGQNGHSSGLRRPFGLALAPPPLTCHRSWGLGANPTDALGGPHEHGRPLPGTLRLKASLRR